MRSRKWPAIHEMNGVRAMAEDWSVLSRVAPGPDEVITFGDLPEQVIDVWNAEAGSERPLVVIVHGGFWKPEYDRMHVRPMANALRDDGWDVAALEYRRVPGDPDVMVSDVAAALATFDRSFVTIGHSAGGHLVLWAAAHSRAGGSQIVGTVALAPVADLELAESLALGEGAVAAYLGEPASRRADLDPVRLPTPATPVTIVHGNQDEIVPLPVAQSYVDHHRGTRMVRVDGAAHFALIDPLSTAWKVVVDELRAVS